MEGVGRTLSHGEDRIDEVLAQHRRDVKTAREQARCHLSTKGISWGDHDINGY